MDWDRERFVFDSLDFTGLNKMNEYISNSFGYKAMLEKIENNVNRCTHVDGRLNDESRMYQLLANRKQLDTAREDCKTLSIEITNLLKQLKKLDKRITASENKINRIINKKDEAGNIYEHVDILFVCQFEKLDETFYDNEIVIILNKNVTEKVVKKLSIDNLKYLFKCIGDNIGDIHEDVLNLLYTKVRENVIKYIENCKDESVFTNKHREKLIDEMNTFTGMPKEFVTDVVNKFDSLCVLYSMKNSE